MAKAPVPDNPKLAVTDAENEEARGNVSILGTVAVMAMKSRTQEAVSLRPLAVLALAMAFAVAACNQADSILAPDEKAHDGVALNDEALKFLTVKAAGEDDAPAVLTVLPARLSMRPQALAHIGAPAAGRVASIRVRPGERVVAGAILLTIQSADAAGARAALEQAEARAAAAEDALRRQSEMMSRGVGLEVERFAAQTAAREARAELEHARRSAALVGTGEGDVVSVRAPSSGVVTAIKAAAGAMVAPGGDTLVEIADASRLWLVAEVPEADTASVAKGERVAIFIPSQNRSLDGVIDGLGPEVEPDTRRLPIYVGLDGDLSGLTSGMQAELRFTGNDDGLLRLPVEAVLIKNGKQKIVYVQQPDGRFVSREVRTGTSKGGFVPILEGLQRGERVVVKGALLLDNEAEQLL